MLFQLKVYFPSSSARKKLVGPCDIRSIARLVRKFNPPKHSRWNDCQVFYTLLGWQQFGLVLAHKLRERGYELRICCIDKTTVKEIAYQDDFQVLAREERFLGVRRPRSVQRRVLRNQPKPPDEED